MTRRPFIDRFFIESITDCAWKASNPAKDNKIVGETYCML